MVTDANGCTNSTISVTIAQPIAALTATATQVNVNCFGGSTGTATATVSGGTAPYSYLWSNTQNTNARGKKIGSVGCIFPYTTVRILTKQGATHYRECEVDEVGEICISSPGVFEGSTYTEADKNKELFAEGRFLRTGDLGRIDPDGYLFITGRAKDLIIRGGHNIDPAIIEEALMGHPAVAMVGAIGQPDAHAGELPCAYVELVKGGSATVQELMAHASAHIQERAALPKHLEVLPELPKTGVGKVFKPDLRRMAITRTYDAALAAAGIPARVAQVVEDKKRGLVAQLAKSVPVEDQAVAAVLGQFANPWEWVP